MPSYPQSLLLSLDNKRLAAGIGGAAWLLARFFWRGRQHMEQDDCAGAEPPLTGDQHSHATGGVLPNGDERSHWSGD